MDWGALVSVGAKAAGSFFGSGQKSGGTSGVSAPTGLLAPVNSFMHSMNVQKPRQSQTSIATTAGKGATGKAAQVQSASPEELAQRYASLMSND